MSVENKNVWVAISLAIITSVTSLGTAIISKPEITNESTLSKKDLESLEEKINKKIKQSITYKEILIKQNNNLQKKVNRLEAKIKKIEANIKN